MIPLFRKPDDPTIRRYVEETRRLPRKTELDRMRLIVLDTETTGFQVGRDRILSAALFEIVDGQIDIGNSRKWIVYQSRCSPTQATAVHGILPSETRKGVPEKQVLQELIPLLTGAIVVAHHARFDAAMLNEAMQRNLHIRFRNRIVDTATLAMHELAAFHRTGYPNQRPPSLEDLAAHFDLPLIARHTAEGDAFLTAQIFLFLCGRIRRRLKRPLQLRDLPLP